MSHYTTGEIAKLCGVTVRTVQYYDDRALLVPSGLTEGGRRLYSEADVKRLKTICFLREIGLSINTIGKLMREEDPGSVIGLLLAQQKQFLEAEISDRETQLKRLTLLEKTIREKDGFSMEFIGDMAHAMENRKKMNRFYFTMCALGILLELPEIAAVILWIKTGIWWPFALWFALMIPTVFLLVKLYHGKVKYICAKCNRTFRPAMKEFFFANHTLRTRKLTCACCGHKGFAVETWGGDETEA